MNRMIKASLLLFFFALCGGAILTTHFATRRTLPPAPGELYLLVNRQLAAFHTEDFGSAYRYAAVGLQQKFSLAQFELMVRRDFSPMTRVQHVEFGAARIEGASALLQVFLTAPDGVARGFLYSFTTGSDGWKIDGVQSLGAQPARRLRGLRI